MRKRQKILEFTVNLLQKDEDNRTLERLATRCIKDCYNHGFYVWDYGLGCKKFNGDGKYFCSFTLKIEYVGKSKLMMKFHLAFIQYIWRKYRKVAFHER